MENFRKQPGRTSRRRQMDGFITSDSFRGQGSIGFRSEVQPLRRRSYVKLDMMNRPVDDLQRDEGYHPMVQPLISPEQPASTAADSLPPPVPSSPHFGRALHTASGGDRPRRGTVLKKSRGKRLSTGMKRRRSWRKIIKRTLIASSAAALSFGLYFGFKIYFVQKNIFRGGGSAPALAQSVDVSTLNGEGDGRVNVLLLGIGGPGHDAPDLSDTIVIASIDPVNNTASLLSIPRDLWVQIPGYGSNKINAAFAYGKQNSDKDSVADQTKEALALVDKTLAPIIGIPIHYHAVVNFSAFKQAVDAVGGITFDVPEDLYDPTVAWENNYNPYVARAGVQTFNGARALLYSRSRETSSDFARSERQRQVMVALKDKILSAGTFSNPIKISQLLDSFGDNVYTDFSRADMGRVYQIAQDIPSESIISLDLVTSPHNYVTTQAVNGLSAVVPRAGMFEYEEISLYIRNALKDGFILKENAEVVLLNGTDLSGLATKKKEELASYGYNVTEVGDAPSSDYQTTQIIDVSGDNKYTKRYLEQRFGATATNVVPEGVVPGTADFVILLGSNASSGQN